MAASTRSSVLTSCRRRGFSYVEAAGALVILSLGLYTGMDLYGSYARGSIIEHERAIAFGLCTDLMEEILSKEFEEPGWFGSFGTGADENTRADFDDVDDYNIWEEDPPIDINGVPIPGCEDYSREVSVWNVDADDMQTPRDAGSTAAKVIEVIVYKRSKQRAKLIGYRTRYDAD